jgi:hypothetical protein
MNNFGMMHSITPFFCFRSKADTTAKHTAMRKEDRLFALTVYWESLLTNDEDNTGQSFLLTIVDEWCMPVWQNDMHWLPDLRVSVDVTGWRPGLYKIMLTDKVRQTAETLVFIPGNTFRELLFRSILDK